MDLEKGNIIGGSFQIMIKQTQKHKACTCKREKKKLQVVLHQDRRNTRRIKLKGNKGEDKPPKKNTHIYIKFVRKETQEVHQI